MTQPRPPRVPRASRAKRATTPAPAALAASSAPDAALAADIRRLIDTARQRAAAAVNAELTLLYWQVGRRIRQDVLGAQRADYGGAVVAALARQLTSAYGRGWSEKQLWHCLRAAETFPDEDKLSALRRVLSWAHIKTLMYVDEPLKRDFYVELCQLEGWSVRQLQERMQSLLFERSAISRQPEATIRDELQALRRQDPRPASPALLLKDPYLLDFLGLNDRYLERDLEDAILRELGQFLLELGAGFTFMARQKRLQIDNDDFYIDLLFYNRKLRRLVAVELKIGDFRPEYKGQMELYLRWLARHEQEVGENPPLGIILCTGKKQEQIELLELDKSGIHVAEYLTVLPPREALQAKLQLGAGDRPAALSAASRRRARPSLQGDLNMTHPLRPGRVTQSRVVQRVPALASAAGAVTRAWCVAEFGVANDTAGRDLKGLTELGLLQSQGQGRGVRYVLSAGKPTEANRP